MAEGRHEEIAQWQSWLKGQLEVRGWRQADLVNASEGNIKRDRVSKWMTGKEMPSYPNAIIVANSLGVPAAEALRAASFDVESPTEWSTQFREDAFRGEIRSIMERYPDETTRLALHSFSDSDLLNELRRRAEIREAWSYVQPMTHDVLENRLAFWKLNVSGSIDDDVSEDDYEVSQPPKNAHALAANTGKRKADKVGVADVDDETVDSSGD